MKLELVRPLTIRGIMSSSQLERPLGYAEKFIVDRILTGEYEIGQPIPAERELADTTGVTRPTLREAIRRLESEGWIAVHHGKRTIVRDFWREGNLGVLTRVIQHQGGIRPSFIMNLLDFRLLIAPTYTRDAIEYNADSVLERLSDMPKPHADPAEYAAFDWALHRDLAVYSANVIFPLILNGFSDYYQQMARRYFSRAEARDSSHQFYVALQQFALVGDSGGAFRMTEIVMRESLDHWHAVSGSSPPHPEENDEKASDAP